MQQEQIDLFRGWPNPDLLPVPEIAQASQTVLSTPSIYTPGLMYGPDPGYEPLREHIAQWLTEYHKPQEPITQERICITGGASQNMACILQVFTDPCYTRNIWMVAPTYYLACRIMNDAGFAGRLRAVPEDEEGLDITFLQNQLKESEERAISEGNNEPKYKPPKPWRKIYKHLIYATPTFSNPSSKIMSLQRRQQLVRLARQYDALIVTDDVYDFLQWSLESNSASCPCSTASVPRLVDVDCVLDGGPKNEWGNAVSNGSFSKLIGPGARTGFAEGTPKFAYGLSQTGSSHSGGAPSQLTATFIDQLLSSGRLHDHILNVLQPAFARRYRILMAAVREHLLPLGVTLPSSAEDVAGGYFIWIRLPLPLGASDVATAALCEENLRIAEGDLFHVEGDTDMSHNDFRQYVRLCFSWEKENRFVEGVRRLARVIQRLST